MRARWRWPASWPAGKTIQAKQPATAAAPAPAAAAEPPGEGIMVVDGGHATGQTTPENARRDGLTVVDLSDEWLPYVFSEEPAKRSRCVPIWSIWPTDGPLGRRLLARPRRSLLRGVRDFSSHQLHAAPAGGQEPPPPASTRLCIRPPVVVYSKRMALSTLSSRIRYWNTFPSWSRCCRRLHAWLGPGRRVGLPFRSRFSQDTTRQSAPMGAARSLFGGT